MNKVSTNRQKKEIVITKLAEKVQKSKAMVFANYQGMTNHQTETLKKGLRAVDAEFAVTKNTLLTRALSTFNFQLLTPLEGPTATIFAYGDPIAPLKELAKTIKALKIPRIKLGIFSRRAGSDADREGFDILSETQLVQLSTLPSRDVLIAQVVSGFKSPLYGLYQALQWSLTKFVMTLNAIESKKQ